MNKKVGVRPAVGICAKKAVRKWAQDSREVERVGNKPRRRRPWLIAQRNKMFRTRLALFVARKNNVQGIAPREGWTSR